MTEFIVNGTFEDWSGTFPTNWAFYYQAGTTVSKEETIVYKGNYSVKLDIDSGNTRASVLQYPYPRLPGNTPHRLSFYYLNSIVGTTARFSLSAGMRRLKADGSWGEQYEEHFIELPNVRVWTRYDINFITLGESASQIANYIFLFQNSTAPSSQIYFDDVSLDDSTDHISDGITLIELPDEAHITDGGTITDGDADHISDGISLTDTDRTHVSETELSDYITDEIGLAGEVSVSLSDLIIHVTDDGITVTDTGGSGRDRVHDCVSVKIANAYYLASSAGKIFTYSGDYLSDDGSVIVSRWQTGVMTFEDQIPKCHNSFKTVYGAKLVYKDLTVDTPVTIYVSTNGGRDWTYETKTLGTGSGKVQSANFGFIKTGEYFIVAIEHASTDKEFMWLRIELDVVPLGAFFEI